MPRPKKVKVEEEVIVKAPAKVATTKGYIIKMTLGTTVLKGKGDNMLEALQSIEEPVKIFTKCDIEISHGGKSMKQTWVPLKARRLFQKISQPVLAKQFTSLLK